MKLFKLRLRTLKSKLYAIVFVSFVVRIVAFFLLPNTASNLAPDEGTYGKAADWLANGSDDAEFSDYAAKLYVSSRALLLPAKLFITVGITPLDSVRATASTYAFLIGMLVLVNILMYENQLQKVFKNQSSVLWLFSLFLFLPSHFIWSILGLRESATEFWVILTFVLFNTLLYRRQKFSIFFSGSFIFSIIMVYNSRPQVGTVLGAAVILFLVFKINVSQARVLIVSTVLGVVIGYSLTQPVLDSNELVFTAKEIKSDPSPSIILEKQNMIDKLCRSENQIVELGDVKYRCSAPTRILPELKVKNPVAVLSKQTSELYSRHVVNQFEADSAIRTVYCPELGLQQLDYLFCLGWRAPYTTLTFLLRPLLGADVTSTSSLFAAVENIFWLGALLFVAVMFIRNRRLAFFRALAPSLLFFSIYSAAAGAYEGNMGTAFRHKSLILWVVLLLIASTIVATQQRKSEQQGISGSSQE